MRFLSIKNRYLYTSVPSWLVWPIDSHDCFAAGIKSQTDDDGALADGARLGVQYAFEDSSGKDEADGEEVEEHNQDVGEGDAATVIADADAAHAAGYTINRCHQREKGMFWCAPAMADKRHMQSIETVV
jgi:hypothetical protein